MNKRAIEPISTTMVIVFLILLIFGITAIMGLLNSVVNFWNSLGIFRWILMLFLVYFVGRAIFKDLKK